MTYEHPGVRVLDYAPCRYAGARLTFRGPPRSLAGPYLAFLGGTETYGKFVPHPYPDLVEEEIGLTSLNLGSVNAGIDSYLAEPDLLDLVSGAEVAVIQVMGAQNLSNRFYKVHARRNDRFLEASTMLRTIYREVDFTDFAFTRHLLSSLRERSEVRFAVVAEELRRMWLLRMEQLISRIQTETILLWMGNRRPGAQVDDPRLPDADPLFVDAAMVQRLARQVTAYVEVVASPAAQQLGTQGMAFCEMEAPAAAALPGPMVHAEAAVALIDTLQRLKRVA